MNNRGLTIPFVYQGTGDNYGYRLVEEMLVEKLTERGIDVRVPDSDYSWVENEAVRKIYEKPYKIYDKTFLIMTGVHVEFIPKIMSSIDADKYVMTMWEYSTLPDIFIKQISFTDVTLIVPSRHNYRVFKQYFPYKKIFYVPLGYDKRFAYKKRKVNGNFRFLFSGAPAVRKGWFVLAKAFEEAFTLCDQVELYIKSSPNPNGHEDLFNIGGYKNIIFDMRALSIEELINLYYSAHVFVFPSFGEGFGLTPLEAIASGLVTLSSDATGMGDFISSKTAIKLYTRKKLLDFEGGWRCQCDVVDLKDLIRSLKYVYNSYESVYNRLFPYAAKYVDETFSWDKTADGIIDVIWGKD